MAKKTALAPALVLTGEPEKKGKNLTELVADAQEAAAALDKPNADSAGKAIVALVGAVALLAK